MNKYIDPPVWVKKWSKLLLTFLALCVLTLFTPWRQFSSGDGRVIGLDPNDRFQEIHAPISGFIKQWHVREGSLVKKGDIMVTLSDTDTEYLDRLEVELSANRDALKSAEMALTTGRINLKRQESLFKEGLTARKEWESEKIKISKLEMEVSKAQASLLKIQSGLARQATQKILAPRDGQVMRVRHGEGAQIVKQGDPLLILAPTAQKLAIEMWIDGNDVALIEHGSEARIEFAGWPAIQVPGWPSLAIGTFKAKVVLVDSVASKETKFRVLLEPDGPWPSETFLRQGIRSTGFVLMNQVTLGWEIWRQFNGIPMSTELIGDEVQKLLQHEKGIK
ncbi:MAG: HlyD family efflux transporter periplasmic adaptor subunit [Bacteriovoracaceae bacterium]|nr:HlyD family efflux transporter periplasmic adaptor subunit [Bacteriovoracaceae bacterium]